MKAYDQQDQALHQGISSFPVALLMLQDITPLFFFQACRKADNRAENSPQEGAGQALQHAQPPPFAFFYAAAARKAPPKAQGCEPLISQDAGRASQPDEKGRPLPRRNPGPCPCLLPGISIRFLLAFPVRALYLPCPRPFPWRRAARLWKRPGICRKLYRHLPVSWGRLRRSLLFLHPGAPLKKHSHLPRDQTYRPPDRKGKAKIQKDRHPQITGIFPRRS